jgi:TolB-like protein
MPGIIEGYNYDVFISYRQKDNKHDCRVTEFVNQLKGELEATFKEDISIYFDENPHDGLLETHSVDKSLEDKLKCLIFIPIISQTYCDPKSFAWQHEFCAFNKLAKESRFGRDIKLASGNVASRILPVQIHDLDAEDKKLVEDELGGHLRGIEFIYKEPGVNRPLRSNEDHPDNNLNKTFYRNQINKVANAIKEIITALKKQSQHPEEAAREDIMVKSGNKKDVRTKVILGSVIAPVLIILGILFIPKLFKPKEEVEKSIAVLPFKSLSTDPEKQYQADGMMDAITLHLSKIKDLRVLSRTSTEQYRNPTKTTTAIGRDLGVNYLLEGSFQKFGDSVRLIVQLIRTGKEGHVWAKNYDRIWKNIFSVQSEVAQSIARELHAVITPEAKQTIEKIPTANLTAYDFYQRGKDEFTKYKIYTFNIESLERAEDLYKEALKYDSTFAKAYTGLAEVYWAKHFRKEEYFSKSFMDSVLILSDIALSLNGQLDEAYTIKGRYYYEKGLLEQAKKEFDKALCINPNSWEAYYGLGELYEYDDNLEAIKNYQKAAALNHASELPSILRKIAGGYSNSGFTDKAKNFCLEAFRQDGDSVEYLRQLGVIEGYLGNSKKSLDFLERSFKIDTTNLETLYYLAQIYIDDGQFEMSLKYLKDFIVRRKALDLAYAGSINHRLAFSYWKNGYKKEAGYYFDLQLDECNSLIKSGRPWSQLYYTYYDIAGVYAFRGEKGKAYENLRIFIRKERMPLWISQLIKVDPLFDSIRNEPEFQQILKDVEAKYQAEHERVRKWLEEQGEF